MWPRPGAEGEPCCQTSRALGTNASERSRDAFGRVGARSRNAGRYHAGWAVAPADTCRRETRALMSPTLVTARRVTLPTCFPGFSRRRSLGATAGGFDGH